MNMRWILVLIVAIALVGCKPEERYQNKTVSEWLRLEQDKDYKTASEARNVLIEHFPSHPEVKALAEQWISMKGSWGLDGAYLLYHDDPNKAMNAVRNCIDGEAYLWSNEIQRLALRVSPVHAKEISDRLKIAMTQDQSGLGEYNKENWQQLIDSVNRYAKTP